MTDLKTRINNIIEAHKDTKVKMKIQEMLTETETLTRTIKMIMAKMNKVQVNKVTAEVIMAITQTHLRITDPIHKRGTIKTEALLGIFLEVMTNLVLEEKF